MSNRLNSMVSSQPLDDSDWAIPTHCAGWSVADVVLHLAVAITLVPTDRLWHIARLAWRTLPYAFARAGEELHGPIAIELTGPSGARWSFGTNDHPLTIVRGSGLEFCLVAARRLDPAKTDLSATGPDGGQVLDLVRTYA
jgi:hypothetical protein